MIYLFLADGFEEIEALTPVDVLRRCGKDIKTVSIDTEYVTGSHKITVKADMTIESLSEDGEMYILPGGMPGADNLEKCKKLCEILTKANESGKYIAAICAAPKVLGKLGILKGKKAVCYPGFENALLGAEITNSPVVKDGNIITANGMGSALAFSLALAHAVSDKAEAVAKGILHNG